VPALDAVDLPASPPILEVASLTSRNIIPFFMQ